MANEPENVAPASSPATADANNAGKNAGAAMAKRYERIKLWLHLGELAFGAATPAFADSNADVLKELAALKARNDNGRARCWVGRVAAQKGDFAAAEMAYRSATEKPDALPDALLGVGISILKRGGDATEAGLKLRRAVEAAPGNADAHLALATALALAGDRATARDEIELAAKLVPDDARVKATREDISK